LRYLAVTMKRGPAWDASRDIREQDAWAEHAAFMDGLVDDGYVILGGPFGDGRQVLLIVDAESEDEVHRRFADDPWKDMEVLHVGSIEPWQIWLDGREPG
jgi:uncharacterized protein YciI